MQKEPVEEVEVEGLDVSPCCRSGRSRSMLASLALGQLLAVCLCGTGITSQLLSEKYAVDTPTTQSFVNYFALALVYGPILAMRSERNGICDVLRTRAWKYFILALIDVEANFLLVKAYQFTNLTSIQLLDCFTIPVVLVLSYFILRTRYLVLHIIGVCLCVLGFGCLVWGDVEAGKSNLSGGSNRLLGDLLCLAGATLYGVSNVAEEYLLKQHSRTEYLAMIGLFATFISAIQVSVVDRVALSEISWSENGINICLLYGGFALAMFIFYSVVSLLIQRTSATFFNMSVLTADFYSLIASLTLFQYQFSNLYYVGFVVILVGVIIYSLRATAVRKQKKTADVTCCGCGVGAYADDPHSTTQFLVRDDRVQDLEVAKVVPYNHHSANAGAELPPGHSPIIVAHKIVGSSLASSSDDVLRNSTAAMPMIPVSESTTVLAQNISGHASSYQFDGSSKSPSVSQLSSSKTSTTTGSSSVRSIKYCPKHGVVYMDENGRVFVEPPQAPVTK